jgi:hypothetical protein
VQEGSAELPEVIWLRDARGERPQNTAGIGEFWYEPEIWSLPLSPAARVLYAGLCSFLGHGEINRRDLRNTLKDRTDEELVEALEDLVHRGLLAPLDGPTRDDLPGYEVRSVKDFEEAR